MDTPYQDYAPLPDGETTATATSTTGGPATCNDEQVDEVFQDWCGNMACHGDPGVNNATKPPEAPLWIFSPTRASEWIGRTGTLSGDVDCTTAQIINRDDPGQSLLISSLKLTAPCGLEMPDEYPLVDETGAPRTEEYAQVIGCIESWVKGVVANAGP